MLEMPLSVTHEYYPFYIYSAAEMMGYNYAEEAVADFEERWGGLEWEHVLRGLMGSEEKERLFAMYALACLGYAGGCDVRDTLLPFLESALPKERWASALCLGKMQEPKAWPHLLRMLTEFLPPDERYRGALSEGHVDQHYGQWRCYIPAILVEWKVSFCTELLLKALQSLLTVEQGGINVLRSAQILLEGRLGDGQGRRQGSLHSQYEGLKIMWKYYKKNLVYALGREGAFDGLKSLKCDERQKYAWYVLFLRGYFHDAYPEPDVFFRLPGDIEWQIRPEIKRQVEDLLEEWFGVPREIHKQCFAAFEYEMLSAK